MDSKIKIRFEKEGPRVEGIPENYVLEYLARDSEGTLYLVDRPKDWTEDGKPRCNTARLFVGSEDDMKQANLVDATRSKSGMTRIRFSLKEDDLEERIGRIFFPPDDSEEVTPANVTYNNKDRMSLEVLHWPVYDEEEDLSYILEKQTEIIIGLSAELEKRGAENEKYKTYIKKTEEELRRFRERIEKEKANLAESANKDVILNILPTIDNLERALESTGLNGELSGEYKEFVKGVRNTYDMFCSALKKFGVERFDSLGEQFDPKLHEAVMKQNSDEHPENTIIQVFEQGYRYISNDEEDGKLLKAAKVVVC